jgi:ethanolamine utilization microcompartment shell protein EutL
MQDDVGKLVQEQMARSPTADDGFRRVVRTGTLHDVSSANETFHEAIDEAGRNPVAAERPAEKNGDAPLG